MELLILVAVAAANQMVIAAVAEAEATLKKAEAEAAANEKINASLSDGVLRYQQIEKWDGKYPNVVSSDSGILVTIPDQSNTATTESGNGN